jgi:CheY-like chemotaxis protein
MIDRTTNSRRLALLVEDSLVNQKLLTHFLNAGGFDVVLAVNGQEAFDKFKRQSFDVVIMDVQMPIMDGLEATRLIRQHEKEEVGGTPIVGVTAGMDRNSCISAGMNDYLAKPVHAPDFHEVLERWCA